jgi:NitT/TauT family transport system ATP-binding protein
VTVAPALEFDQVCLDYRTPAGDPYRVIDRVTLAVRPGAFVAIVGPSGCGKSTLLNLAAGLLRPTSGAVRVDGRELAGLNRRATYMFQQDALLPWKNVRANVALGLTIAGVPRTEANARAQAWLERVGLASFAGHFPAQLSGGMRKRVAMAQNWIVDRSQLLMDESFSALDIHTRQMMETELLALWESPASPGELQPALDRSHADARRTVLFVTHDLEEAIALADQVVVLSAGPASRVVATHAIDLDRPRNLLDLRASPPFEALYRAIWSVLRQEVVRSQKTEARPA